MTVAATLPDARVAILEGQGHSGDIFAPQLASKYTVAFLREQR